MKYFKFRCNLKILCKQPSMYNIANEKKVGFFYGQGMFGFKVGSEDVFLNLFPGVYFRALFNNVE